MFSKLKSFFSAGTSPPAASGSAYKKHGDEHLKLDRLEDAAACYRRAIAENPDYVDACVGLGFALAEQKQDGEAEHYLRHALSIDPAAADAHYILGTISRNRNDLVASIDHFSRAIAAKPDFEFAHRHLFAALLQAGQVEKAKEAIGRAIDGCPESAEFRYHLGNLLSREGNHDNALACYRKALSIQPASPNLHTSFADALARRAQPDQAVASYRKALWFAPNFVTAHLGLGAVLQSQGKLDEAIECYRSAVALEPENAAAHQNLGNVLLERGQTRDAVACYERVLSLDPETPVKHLIAALSGRDSESAPSHYVEQLFDQYAQKFDSHLVGVLRYNVPEKLVDLLRPHAQSSSDKWSVLDLGCGTGLSGAAIAPYARQLVGVDISSKMLEKARERNLYHRLEHLDLLTMMQRETASAFDVVFAADVFVYVGKLDDLVHQANRLLRPGGLFAFSVESRDALTDEASGLSERQDYQLNVTGRYAHSIAYLARMAERHGFGVLSTTVTQSRLDKGKPVQGYLVLWRRSLE